jgi:hypothetical protein
MAHTERSSSERVDWTHGLTSLLHLHKHENLVVLAFPFRVVCLVPTLAAMKLRQGWGTLTFLAGLRVDHPPEVEACGIQNETLKNPQHFY